MKFKDYALAIVFAPAVLVPQLEVSARYLNENQQPFFQFSSSAHVCLLAYDIVQCVGYNYYGQLGQDSSDAFGTPVLLNFPNSITARPKKVVTGYDHTCTLFNDGHVWCNGSNGFKQLGDETSANSATPIQVKKGSGLLLGDVIDLEAGAYHNCAIQDTGAMYCWGFNVDGQLGMNSIIDGSSTGKKAVQMALSMSATCVITEEDLTKVKCVGFDYSNNDIAFTAVDLGNVVTTQTGKQGLVAGSTHFCALLDNTKAKCWGTNHTGQLGIGSAQLTKAYHASPVFVLQDSTGTELSGIMDIKAAYSSTCLVASGRPMCFGNNRSYQMGIANGGVNVLYPTLVASIDNITGKSLLSMHVGETTGHAVFDDKSVHSVGTNRGGTFGDSSPISSENIIGDLTNAIATQINFVIGSDEPSLEPQSSPSTIPSLSTSDLPSLSPSLGKSDLPSLSPSLSPSDSPSLSLSLSPSSSPSNLPSLSLSPTQVPDLTVDHYNYNRGWRVEKNVRLLADVNGDGKPDIVGFANSGVVVTLSTPSYGFETPTYMLTGVFGYNHGWRVEYHPRFLEDVNGDGQADIIGFYNDGVYVSYSESTSFTTPVKMYNGFAYNGGWRIESHPRFVTDMNGDGKADIVGFASNKVFLSYSNGNGFDAPIIMVSNFFVYGSGWRITAHPRFLEDVDGDGKKDIIGFYNDGVYVSFSNDNGGWDSQTRVSTSFVTNQGWLVERHPRFVTDMNGDGKADIVGFGNNDVYVSYSNGNGFDAPIIMVSNFFVYGSGWRITAHPRFLEDVDGDGKKDIIGFYNDGDYVSFSNDNGGWDSQTRVSTSFGTNQGWLVERHPRFVTDMNGDGKADIVGFGNFVTYIHSFGY